MPRRSQQLFTKTRKGTYRCDVPDGFLDVVAHVMTQYRQELTKGVESLMDPGHRRLHPAAYHDDPQRDAEYHSLMGDELLASRLHALDETEATLRSESLTLAQLTSWMLTVNGIRLLLGTRLDVTEDDGFDGPADADEATSEGFKLYWALGEFLEHIVAVQLAD